LGSNVVAAAPVPSLLLVKLSLAVAAAAACGGAWWVVCLFACLLN